MRLQLTTVSPVHIGNGEELEVSDYELENGSYYRLNIDKAFKIIENHNQFEKVVRLIDEKSSRLSRANNNKEQSDLRQELNLLKLCKNVSKPLHDQLKSELKNISDYTFIDKLPKSQTKSGGKNSRKISVQLKTADRQTYIPGSSLKGAIRTALVASVISSLSDLEKMTIVKYVNVELNRYKNADEDARKKMKKRLLSILDDELISATLYCGKKKDDWDDKVNNQLDFSDAKFDLLKLLHINDTNTSLASDTLALISPAQYSAKNGRQELRHPCEAIDSKKRFAFNLWIDMDFLLEAKKRIDKNNGAFDEYDKIWIGFRDKVERLFGFKLDELNANNKSEIEQKIIGHILQICRQFYGDVLDYDVKWIERAVQQSKDLQSLEAIYTGLQALRKENALLLKLNFGAGFHAKTVILEMKKHDTPESASLKSAMQDILDTMEIGKPRNLRQEYHANMEKYPTSRALVEYDNYYDTLGWVLLCEDGQLSEEQSTALNEVFTLKVKNDKQISKQMQDKQKPKDAVVAEICDDTIKPVKVRILEGTYNGVTTIMPGIHIVGLGLKIGSLVFVKLELQKGKIVKAIYFDKYK